MGKRSNKLGRAAHIKRHTVGTSNEISFSVLDAVKNELEGDVGKDAPARTPRFGHISLFTLPLRRKKTIATPKKESGLHLSSGEFVSAEGSTTPLPPLGGIGSVLAGATTDATGQAKGESKTAASAVGLADGRSASRAPARSPEEEVARRKARRRLHRIMAASLIIAIGLALAGIGGWYLFQDHQRHLGQVALLDEALDLIRSADDTVVALDGLVANPFDEASLAGAEGVLEKLPTARAQLEQADEVARRVSVDMRESSDKEAANQTVSAASARIALLDSGRQIVEQALEANALAGRARAAWQDVVKGDALAREAAALVVDTTDENVTASKEKTNAAIEAFSAAQSDLDELAAASPDVDWSALADYVAKRLEAMGYALASNDAFLVKDKEEAVVQNDAYNRADAEAAALAAKLPHDVAQPVFTAFEQATATLFETYSTARSQAGSADAFLRDYLGTSSK